MQRIKIASLIGIGVVAVTIVILSLLGEMLLRRGVEDMGSRLTTTPVQLQNVELSLFSGRIALNELRVGNPSEYETPTALSVRAIRVSLDWSSLLHRPILIREIVIEGPEVTIEGSLSRNNLTILRDHVLATTHGPSDRAPNGMQPSEESRRVQVIVTKLRIVDARLNLLLRAGTVKTNLRGVSLGEITLKDLGNGAQATSIGDLTGQVLTALAREVTGAATKNGTSVIEEAGKSAGRSLSEAVQGVKELLK